MVRFVARQHAVYALGIITKIKTVTDTVLSISICVDLEDLRAL